MLKLNVISPKNENGDDATVSVDTVSLEGGGGGKVAGRPGHGTVPANGTGEGGLHSPSSLARQEAPRGC